jgi:hypothetical protein
MMKKIITTILVVIVFGMSAAYAGQEMPNQVITLNGARLLITDVVPNDNGLYEAWILGQDNQKLAKIEYGKSFSELSNVCHKTTGVPVNTVSFHGFKLGVYEYSSTLYYLVVSDPEGNAAIVQVAASNAFDLLKESYRIINQ